MDLSNIKEIRPIFLWSLPAIVVFLVALIPTLKYGYPLSLDIYYHIHMAHLYMTQGFTYWDPLTYAPFGRPIYYPPLFHYSLAVLGFLFNNNLLTIVRGLQPIFGFLIFLSFTYVTYKLYDIYVAFFAGFFAMFTSLINQFILPIAENLGLIIFPFSLYFYYLSVETNNYRYAAISGVLAGVILLDHTLSMLNLIIIITIFSLMLLLSRRKINLNHFWVFLGFSLLVASIWWLPLLLKYGYVFRSPATEAVPLWEYVPIFGVISLILTPIGGFLIYKRRETQDILILAWLLSLLALANVYLLGISVLSERILTFAVFPLAIMAGLGLNYVRIHFNKKLFYCLLVITVAGAVISATFYMSETKPLVSSSEVDIGNWFKAHGDKQGVVVSSSYLLDPTIVAISGQPVATGGYDNGRINELDIGKYINGNFGKSDLIRDKVEYIVLNIQMKTPPYFTVVYQNSKYKICMLNKGVL
jgi:asparagine N-glycosylation enzyme membrane subunit Stt3